jgi:hypothetical protein
MKSWNLYFEELFSGVKKTSIASSYQLLLLLRRIALISWMIFFQFMPNLPYLMVPGVYQFLHLCLIILVRPFERIKDNIVEIFNETVFTVLLCGFAYFDRKDRWSNVTTEAFVYLIMAPGIFMLIVTISRSFLLNL